MSSSEPPSRLPPKEPASDTKASRDEFSRKVEKIREVDPDEQARKKRFAEYYKGTEDEETKSSHPSPFDLYSKKASSEFDALEADIHHAFDKIEEEIIPAPSNAWAPNVNLSSSTEEDDEETSALPQSKEFWNDCDWQEKSPPKTEYQEKLPSETKPSSLSEHRKKVKEIHKKEQVAQSKKKTPEKTEEISILGPPGKPVAAKKKEPLQEPIAEAAAPSSARTSRELKDLKDKKKPTPVSAPGIPTPPLEPRHQREEREQRERQILQIEAPSTTSLPPAIEPLAMNAAVQAAPYLSSTTVALFYQMVGTIYVMAGPPGINRTEILLNNPSFASSKFFGARITIEKYATAPDSLNIRLTGSEEAVALFKENIPSLLTAFQNGRFNFRIGRLDAEYTLDRPVFRRKESGQSKSDAGGGDLGEGKQK